MFCYLISIVLVLILYIEAELLREFGGIDKDRKTGPVAEKPPSCIMERIIVIQLAILLKGPQLTWLFQIDSIFVNGSFLSFPRVSGAPVFQGHYLYAYTMYK
jgi:hypothetical protein